MTVAKQPRLNNILLIIIIVAILVIAIVLAWHIATDTQGSILRPAQKAPSRPQLPEEWYEKFGRHEAYKITDTFM